jgi:Tfp pilus assembly protein PilV
MNTFHRRLALGVALIEALVALAVVGFGMLAVVGSIATLRQNGDVARQRSEAIRIAQDLLEEWRGFSVLDTTADRMAYADLETIAGTDALTVTGANATFTVERFVGEDSEVAGTNTAQRKHVLIVVGWADRTGGAQEVRLSTAIAGIDPDLRGVGVVPPAGVPSRWVNGRRAGIPPGARQISNGRSVFVPLGQPSGDRVALVFNNVTGRITRCVTSAQDTASVNEADVAEDSPNCNVAVYRLLSGFLRFRLSGAVVDSNAGAQALATATEAGGVTPTIRVVRTSPLVGTDTCFTNTVNNVVEYVCAVYTFDTGAWSGQLVVDLSPVTITSTHTDASASNLRICRFFDLRLVSGLRSFENVDDNLTSRNLVVVPAGDGTTANSCDLNRTPRVWRHQPQ